MTTLLPQPELAMLRTIKKAAIELFVCLIIDRTHPGQAIAVYQVADILEIDQRTVQKHLRSLSAAGIMLEQKPFWYVVTPAGRNTLFGWNAQPLSLSIEESGECSQIVPVAHNVCKSIDEEDEEFKLNLKDSSSSSINYAQNVQILEATHLLFGGSITLAKLDLNFFEPDWILTWVAKSYADQATPQKPRGLTNPLGFIYRQLEKHELPSATIRAQYPVIALPDEFMDAIGRFDRTCDRCDEKFTKLDEFKAHHENCLFTPQPELDEQEFDASLVADETVSQSVEQAWESALGQLQMEMPPASFDTWARDTKAIRWEDGVLSIGARNAYARDWLESRLSSTVQRLLMGIMNQEVKVRFVVAAETE